MPSLSLKPSHKPIKNYYEALDGYAKLGVVHEGAVLSAFQQLLESCGRQFQWTLVLVVQKTFLSLMIDGSGG